jgi:hypothetical protein
LIGSAGVSPCGSSAKAVLQEPVSCVGLPAQQLIWQVWWSDERAPEGMNPARSASASIAASTIRAAAVQLSFGGRNAESKLSYL